MRSPILTIVIGPTSGLNAGLLFEKIGYPGHCAKPLNLVFLGEDKGFANAKLVDPLHGWDVLWEKSDYDDGSAAVVLAPIAGGPTTILIIAESPSVITDTVELVQRLLVSDARYVVACRPFLAPRMVEAASKLAFLHLPFPNEQAIQSSTAFALARVQMEEGTSRAQERTSASREVREAVVLALGNASQKQAGVENALATELLRSANRLVKLQITPPFAARGFSHDDERVTQQNDCLVMGPKLGPLLWGPYMKLPLGSYRVGWLLSLDKGGLRCSFSVDVAIDQGIVSEARVEIDAPGAEWVWLDFNVEALHADSPIEFRIRDLKDSGCRLHEIAIKSQED